MLYDPTTSRPRPVRRIAVIGTGIAGMSAAWLLSQRHDVTVYEKAGWVGGHSNTVDVETPHGTVPVDTGFIVYNPANYPNLVALFEHLGVRSIETDMALGVSLDGGRIEYSSQDLNTLVGQRRNIARPRFWRMCRDIVRFYTSAKALHESREIEGVTLGEFLAQHNYSDAAVDDHILPMCAAIWSTTPERMRTYPMQAFVRFFYSHGLFDFLKRIQWRTVAGGSRTYVEKLTAAYRDRITLGSGAKRIARQDGFVIVEDAHGRRETFTDVVLACHADEALALLTDADPLERRILGAFGYTDNLAVLHTDPSLMPRRRRVWASWNYVGSSTGPAPELCVTYWMNRLQSLDRRQDLFVTLNPVRPPRPETVHRSFDYTHPRFDHAALSAQRELWRLQGRAGTWFAGSYFGYGFHEDALQSGLAAAENFGVRRPWTVPEESGRIHLGEDQLMAAQ